jgi:SagB-type dehydrogenase family enzyme
MSKVNVDFQTDACKLPQPQLPAGATLVDALKHRASTCSFAADEISLEQLSALLWATFGIIRQNSRHRTAPSAHNWQEIDVYAVTADGSYRYDLADHRLLLVKATDLRAATGRQDFVGTAPLNLVYVADYDRMPDVDVGDRPFLVGADAGCIAQNVYLYCASAGLATVVRALVDRKALALALGLRTTQHIALTQSVRWRVGGPPPNICR